MPDSNHHCPFLNRADARCSKHFSLDALGYAFGHCFDYYEGCGVYLELLVERRVRRARGHDFIDGAAAPDAYAHHAPLVQLTVAGRRNAHDRDTRHPAHAAVAGGYPHGATDPALLSHAPGL